MIEIDDIKYLAEYQKYGLDDTSYIHDMAKLYSSKTKDYCIYNKEKSIEEYNSPVASDALKILGLKNYYELALVVLKEYTRFKIKGDKDINKIVKYIKENLKKEEAHFKEGIEDYENIFQICTYLELLFSNIIQSIILKEKIVNLHTYTLEYEELLSQFSQKELACAEEKIKNRNIMYEKSKQAANLLLDKTKDLDNLTDIGYPVNIPIVVVKYIRELRDNRRKKEEENILDKIQTGKSIEKSITMTQEINDNPYQDKQHVKALYLKEMLTVTRIRNRNNSDLLS